MTNYNERLDEVLDGGIENIQDGVTLALRVGQNIDYHTFDARIELKQALTSLFKELVAEAKPLNKQGEIDIDEPAYNDGYYSGACNALERFEQNLLKALENE